MSYELQNTTQRVRELEQRVSLLEARFMQIQYPLVPRVMLCPPTPQEYITFPGWTTTCAK